MKNIAINGFGRIGRLVFRALLNNDNVNVTLVNDLTPPDNLAYLLKYDTIHGMIDAEISSDHDHIYVNGKAIKITSFKDPRDIPYNDYPCDVVIESTGIFKDQDTASYHLEAGAKRVIVSAPSNAKMFVYGVNHKEYASKTDTVVSCASCTTNCLAPIAKVVHNEFEIIEGLMTTVHAVTATQKTQDSHSLKDFRGGRGIINNIIPSSTGAAKAVGKVMPELDGKLTGMALRVPVDDVSIVDLTVRVKKKTSLSEITKALENASNTTLKGILGVTNELVVSSDIKGCSLSSLYDEKASIELNGNFFKLLSWYDNEWGYANRVCDMLMYMLNNTKD